MFAHIPSLITVSLAAIVVAIIYKTRLPLLFIAIVTVLLIIFTANQNLSLFATQYSLMSQTGGLTVYAPYIMIGLVILFSILYIFMLNKKNGTTNIKIPEFKNTKSLFNIPALKGSNSSSILEKIV
jgi:hypothetical protein